MLTESRPASAHYQHRQETTTQYERGKEIKTIRANWINKVSGEED